MTRKRLKKLLMGRGYSRNYAEEVIWWYKSFRLAILHSNEDIYGFLVQWPARYMIYEENTRAIGVAEAALPLFEVSYEMSGVWV